MAAKAATTKPLLLRLGNVALEAKVKHPSFFILM
jgi:hypothetical protein